LQYLFRNINKEIPHFSIVSSGGADKKSMFFYMRNKGDIEEALTNLKLPYLSIMRPGTQHMNYRFHSQP
jgi:uncharacterized protein YbjT (DUF2867 family)